VSLALALAISPGLASRAADATGDPGGPNLDQLLKLPGSVEYQTEKKGGATRSEWRQRFHEARVGVEDAEKQLKVAQDKLAEVAGAKSEWQFTPPGVPTGASENTEGTSSFQLRQDVKRRRNEVDRAKARLRELEVEANLAGIPEAWRASSTEARSENDLVIDSETSP
jgi:hypothetical protein